LRKKPKAKAIPEICKRPIAAPQNSPESILKRKPSWRFGLLDFHSSWGWFKLQSPGKIEGIINKLKNFERMTWGEIEKNKQSHSISLDCISKEARDRLKKMNRDDLDPLFSLRLSGKERIWGWRDQESFYIIWWDPEHTVYPVPKRHS
jgi:hypothetical protein